MYIDRIYGLLLIIVGLILIWGLPDVGDSETVVQALEILDKRIVGYLFWATGTLLVFCGRD